MSQEKFIQTLKSLGFPNVDDYSPSDFDSIFSDPELKQFLDYFCTLDENNVLTEEDLNEYSSIPPDKLAELECLVKDEEAFACVVRAEDETREEEQKFLQQHLSHIKRCSKTLHEQKELLVEHLALLLDEKVECQKTHLHLRKIYDNHRLEKVPQAEAELSSTLKSISELITELKAMINASNEGSNILPGLNLKDIEEYFAEEEKIVTHVQSYLQNNFEFKDEIKSTLNIPGLSNDRILKETHILKKSLEKSKMLEFHSVCSYKKKKVSEKFSEDYEAGNFSNISEASSSQLSILLKEEAKWNEKLRKKESFLMSSLSDAVNERLEAQFNEIAIAHSNEVFQSYKEALEKISFPLLHMLDQKARLDLLILYLHIYQKHLQTVKKFIDQASCFVDSEQKSFLERKQQYEEAFKEIQEDKYLPEDSIFLSAFKILNNDQHQDMARVKLSDVTAEIEQLHKEREHLKKRKEDKNNTIESLEKQCSEIEKYVLKGKEFSELMNLENNFCNEINQLDVLLAEVHSIYKESENYWNYQNKLLHTKRNLKLARSLYLYALLEEERFENIILNLKKATKYGVDSSKES